MDNIKITLETLYDILRNEKKKEELQTLEDTFFFDVVLYLKEKKSFLETKKDNDDLFASGERDKLDYEVRSIKRILKEIYEKREKKIIDIALNRSRTGSDIIDTSSMLKEEKEFYQKALNLLDLFRKGVLLNLFKCELPSLIPDFKQEIKPNSDSFRKFEGAPPMPSEDVEDPLEENGDNSDNNEENSEEDNEDLLAPEENNVSVGDKKDFVKIRLIRPMPSFVWKDLKTYGPYEVGEEIEIFPEVAELMIRKARAEKV